MSNNLARKLSSLPPHIAIIAVLAAVVGAAGLALLLSRSEPQADAQIVPRAARIERVDGNVGVARVLDNKNADQLEWDEATMNAPLSVGDRIYARNNARATLAFTGRNYARLNPGASLDVLSLTDRRTQLALRNGSAVFDVGHLEPGELFEVATPNGAIDFYEPGLYQIGMGEGGSTIISVLSGLAQVVGLAGSGQISKGEILTLAGQAAAQILLSKLAPDLAGNILDDYYGYRYPNLYDGRYRDYDRYLDDPDYYDPYRRSTSYRYLSQDVPGLYDLDEYGQWRDVDGYGRCWSPRVSTGWAPYRHGYWDVDNVWGPTWVSQEPWGWAPYHYGRWAYANDRQWVWVPDQAHTYAPALVAFIPVERTNQIGWVPLAPGEPYAPRYYDSNFRPQYLGPDEVVSQVVNIQRTFVNMAVPTAVTVVPVPEFTEVIEPAEAAHVSPQLIAQSQPVLDPYVVESLRQVVMRDEKRRRKFRLPQELEHQIFNTPVVTSEVPAVPAVGDDAVQALNVATVPEKQKKRKLRLDQNGQVAAEATQAAQGDKAARRELRELERQQRKQEKIERRAARQQAEAQHPAIQNQEQASQIDPITQARKEHKAQKRLERQQQAQASEQQQHAATERQAELRKQMKRQERQARIERAQQQSAEQAQMEQQLREQRKAEKRAARAQRKVEQSQQSAMAQAAEQAQILEQRKAQKRAERQQRMMQQYEQAAQAQAAERAQMEQMREQRKAQKRAERQQRMMYEEQYNQQKQPVFVQPVEKDREQRKQEKRERRAARQQEQ